MAGKPVDYDPFALRTVPVEHDPFMGDPEAVGSAMASTAMEPVVGPYLRDVATGQVAQRGAQDIEQAFANRDWAALAGMVGPGAIRAYHGSPHDFSKFDLSKIGTGEGAQAYGHGLYFAENEGVARQYRDALGRPAIELNGQKIAPTRGSPEDIALAHLEDAFASQSSAPWARAYQSLQKALSYAPETPTGTMRRDMEAAIEVLGGWQQAGAKPANMGRMYEVNINAEPHQFLDWDKPLSEQPHVQAAFDKLGASPGPRWELMPNTPLATGGARPSPAEASAALQKQGIPGIRYLDQGSRGAGEGTHNYVLFNDKLIDIVRKYGLAGLVAGGSARLVPVDHDPFNDER